MGFDQSRYYGNMGYNVFVKYQNASYGDKILRGERIRVLTRPLEIPEIDCSRLEFERNAAGKSFINDSYGYCRWAGGYNDGDTAYFIDNVTSERFTVRFLAIDCPEVSHSESDKGDPWGDEAASYVRSILSNAKTIIIESESDSDKATDVYGRYLAYVWVDGILLNYQVIAEAYSNFTGHDGAKYYSYLSDADSLLSVTGRRFYGEYDPNYSYD